MPALRSAASTASPIVTGVDLIELSRIEATLRRFGQRFLDRIYTPAEQGYCRGRVPELAARFAAKEAITKALGSGLAFMADIYQTGVAPTDVEVVSMPGGRPEVGLSGRAQALAESQGLRGWSISLSHSNTIAVAFVVAWRDDILPDGRLKPEPR